MDGTTSAARPGGIVTVLAVAGIMAAFVQTLVVPLIGELPRMLDTTASNASWVVTSTLLAGAVAMPVVGRLGDLYGKQRMLLVSTVPLTTGSVLCALADSLLPMVVGRGLQGMGMGLIPLGISVLRDVLPPARLGSAIALMSASMGVGGALGLPGAAAVAEYANWRALFWSAAGLSLLIGALIWLLVPAVPGRGGGRFDFAGAAGLGAALVSLLLAVSKGADWGWTSAATLGLFAAAALLTLLWGRWELRIAEPLVDLRVAARRQVLLTNLASIVLGMAMYAQALIVPQLLQLPAETGYGHGRSMVEAGLWMLPGGLMMMAVSPLGARLSAARGPKTTLCAGSLVIALGYGSAVVLMGSTWGLLAVTVTCNIGIALAYGAMPALIMSAVPPAETASANGFNTLMRSIGTSASAAVIGAVLASMTIDLGGHALPSQNGFRAGLLIGCGVAFVAAALTLALPGRATRPAPKRAAAPAPTEV